MIGSSFIFLLKWSPIREEVENCLEPLNCMTQEKLTQHTDVISVRPNQHLNHTRIPVKWASTGKQD